MPAGTNTNGMRRLVTMLVIISLDLGFRVPLAAAQDDPPPPDPDVIAFLQALFENQYSTPFILGESSLLITPTGGDNTYTVQVGLGTIDDPDNPAMLLDGGLYVEAESFLIANEDLSDEALADGDGVFLAIHEAFAGTLLTPSGGAVVVSGLLTTVTLDGLNEELGQIEFVTLTPFHSHDTVDAAIAAAAALTEDMKVAYGVLDPMSVLQVESDGSSSSTVCITQFKLCLRSAAFRLQACQDQCTATGLIAVPGLCLGSLACGPFAPLCCLVGGGSAALATHVCSSGCVKDFQADKLDCQADLLGCDPSIVIVPN